MIYSGKFVLRIDPRLHAELSKRARDGGLSLNRLCSQLLSEGLKSSEAQPLWRQEVKKVLPYLKTHFGNQLQALAVFGSQIQGRASSSSDLDLLIVLKSSAPIQRGLYQWWEETIPKIQSFELSPHFVNLPKHLPEAGGFWFEIALHSVVLYQKKKSLSRWLVRVKELIDSGVVQRQWSNGHPYWVHRERRVS